MRVYIRSASCISAQNTFGNAVFLNDALHYTTPRLQAIEPDYKQHLDAKAIRRMSRIIKMGVTAAADCLSQAAVSMPDAIVTGTAYGCLEDTGVFLTRMIGQDEQDLSPTAFIQSTHNTVGAQIALSLQCHQYNNTFVHKGFSFEGALTDAQMLLYEGGGENVLVGGIDELTDASFTILNRFGLYKKEETDNFNLYNSGSDGTIAGEGAAFFVLSSQETAYNLAVLERSATFYRPGDSQQVIQQIKQFLNGAGQGAGEIDLVITGKNGDAASDILIDEWSGGLFAGQPVINFKHLSGEYPTASAFALWLGANILRRQVIPAACRQDMPEPAKPLKKVLICNQYKNKYYSLMLLSAV